MKSLAALVLVACAQPPPAAKPEHRRGGELMIEVGTRYARLPREIAADHWELAAYDLHELREVFEDDLLPRAWNDNPAMQHESKAFLTGPLAALEASARTRDQAGWPATFDATTKACNACHAVAHVAFIVIDKDGR
jgi:hypothetical protein